LYNSEEEEAKDKIVCLHTQALTSSSLPCSVVEINSNLQRYVGIAIVVYNLNVVFPMRESTHLGRIDLPTQASSLLPPKMPTRDLKMISVSHKKLGFGLDAQACAGLRI
jgi:hypothetical protein